MQPNLRKTPKGGRIIASMMSTQVAVPSFIMIQMMKICEQKPKTTQGSKEISSELDQPNMQLAATRTRARFKIQIKIRGC